MTQPKSHRDVWITAKYWPHQMLCLGVIIHTFPNLEPRILAKLTGLSNDRTRQLAYEWSRFPERWKLHFYWSVVAVSKHPVGSKRRIEVAAKQAFRMEWLMWLLGNTSKWSRHRFYSKFKHTKYDTPWSYKR